MLLADWSFCCAMRLSPSETHAQLDLLQTLRAGTTTTELTRICLEQLAKADAPALIYAVPAMLTAADRHRADPQIADLVSRRLVEAAGPGAPAPLVRALRAYRSDDAESAVACVREVDSLITAGNRPPSVRPYLDLADFRVELVTLALLNQAALSNPGAARTIASSSERLSLLDNALSGRTGRLALLLAARIRALAGVAPGEVTAYLWKAADAGAYEPDVLEATARIHFERPGADGRPAVDPVAVEREAVTFTVLHQVMRRTPADAEAAAQAYQRLSGPGLAAPAHLPMMLWHSLLWNLAAEQEPQAAAVLLERWWGPPLQPDWSKEPRRRNYRISCRWDRQTNADLAALLAVRRDPALTGVSIDNGEVARTDPAAGAMVFSPWLDRQHSRYNAKDFNDVYEPKPAPGARPQRPAYPAAGDATAMIRLLASAGVLTTLLRATAPKPPDYLIALHLHLDDVLNNYRFRDFLSAAATAGKRLPADGPLTLPLAGLAVHVQKVAFRLGTGLDDDVEPAAVAAYLDRKVVFEESPRGLRLAGRDRTQAAQILMTAAPRNAAHWLQQATDTATRLPSAAAPMPQHRWFDGDPSPAATVLEVLLVRVREYLLDRSPDSAEAVLAVPILVAADLFPDLVPDRGASAWLGQERPVSMNQALLAGELTIDQWMDAAPNTDHGSPRQAEFARLALATERLAAFLRAPRDERVLEAQLDDMLRDWRSGMSSINDPGGLPKILRRRLVDLLAIRPGDPGPAAAERMLAARAMIVDVIVEFCGWTTRFYDLMLDALVADAGLPPAAADTLRLRALQSLIRRRAMPSVNRARVFDPWHVRETIRHIAQTDAMLNRFVAAVGSRQLDLAAGTLGQTFAASWTELLRSPAMPMAVSADPRERPDPRLVVASTVHPEHGGSIDYLLDRDVAGPLDGQREVVDCLGTDVAALVKDWPPAGPVTLAGVVCAVGDEPGAVWVNCGTGEALRVTSLRPLRTGDPVLVPGRFAGARFVPSGPPAPTRARGPVDGEVRSGRVGGSDDSAWLSLSAPNDTWEYPRGDDPVAVAVRRRWDPDLSRGLNGIEVDQSVDCRWDGELDHWLPIDRSFTQLVAEGVGRTGNVLVLIDEVPARAGRQWRFSLSPGVNYLLDSSAWTPPAYQRLLARVQQGRTFGLLVYVDLISDDDGRPMLDLRATPPADARAGLAPQGPFDERNIAWQELFDNSAVGMAERAGNRWTMATGMPLMSPAVTVRDARNSFRGAVASFELDGDGWTDRGQRTATVAGAAVRAKQVRDPYDPDAGRYRGIRNVRRGAVLELAPATVRAPRTPAVWLLTVQGPTVMVATDSVTPGGVNNKRVGGRSVVIESVSSPRPSRTRNDQVIGIATDDLFADAPGRPADDVLTALRGRRDGDPVEGVAVLVRGGQAPLIGMWWNVAGTVVYVQAPTTAFDTVPENPGDLVEARRVGGAWMISTQVRLIHGRALWPHRLLERGDRRLRDAVRLGHGYVDGEPYTMFEPRGSDELYLLSDHDEAGSPVQGQPAEFLGRRWTAPDGSQYERVKMVGHGREGVRFGVSRKGSLSGSVIVASGRYVAHSTAGGLLDLQCHIEVRAPANAAPVADQVSRDTAAWDAWIDEGDRVLEAEITATGVELLNLRVPTFGGFTSLVARPADDQPRLLGRAYPSAARVLLRQDGHRWVASCREAPPLTVEQFAALVTGVRRRRDGDSVPLDGFAVYYAGAEVVDDVRRHLFEWGHGWTAAVPAERLQSTDNAATGLFFGDRIRRVSFRRTTTPDGVEELIMVVDPDHVDWQIEHRLHYERKDKVVHQTTVDVDPVARTVRIKQVGTANRRLAGECVVDEDLTQATFEDIEEILELAGPDGVAETRILSRLDEDALTGPDPKVRFRFVRPQITEDDGNGLRQGEQTLMYAETIEPADRNSPAPGVYNDVLLPFTLHAKILGGNTDFRVEVTRRRFSYRESLLMQAYESPTEPYSGLPMLVRIEGTRRGATRNGTTKFSPYRLPADLYGWIRSRKGNSYAVVGQVRDGQIVLEIDAGKRFRLPIGGDRAKTPKPGSIVRLDLAGSDQIEILTALPSDRDYLPGAGRPALLLPINKLLNSRPDATATEDGVFAVAGLPGVLAGAGQLGTSLLRQPHPRLGRVRPAGSGAVIEQDPALRAGRFMISDRHQPKLVPVGTRDTTALARPWSALSFADRSAARQAADTLDARWGYHDNWTGWWASQDGRPVLRKKILRDLGPTQEAVFFDERWSSRYRAYQLRSFGLPAAPLITGEVDTWYPVAGVARDRAGAVTGLWLQASPGRVIEVPAQLIVADEAPEAFLTRMRWENLAVGDEIRLRSVDADTHLHALALAGWRPGPRGAFGRAARVLLPVAAVDPEQMSVQLGAGDYTLTFPITEAELTLEPGEHVWLSSDNAVSRQGVADEPAAGDVVLLTRTAGGLRASGTEATVVAAPGQAWSGPAWVRDMLERPELFAAVGGYLPVTVHSVDGGRVEVSYLHQPGDRVDDDQVVRCQVLASAGTDVLLRSGSALYRMPLTQLVPGGPAAAAAAIAQLLRDSSDGAVWIGRRAGSRLESGLRERARPGAETDVEPVGVIPGGVLCRESQSRALRWLPIDEASWVADLTAAEVDEHIVGHHRETGRMDVRVLDSGAISLVRTAVRNLRLERLEVGETVSVAIVAARTGGPGSPIRDYLARTPLDGVLLQMASQEDWPVSPDPVLTEVDRLETGPRPVVEVRGIGERRTRLDLPRWIVNPTAAQETRNRYDSYRAAYAGGTGDDPATAIVAFIGLHHGEQPAPVVLPAEIRHWLRAQGAEAFGLGAGSPLDLLPVLAAIVALHRAGAHNAAFSRPAAQASVWLLRQAGLRAARSIHVEELSTKWVNHPDRDQRFGLWTRLRHLKLDNREPFELLLSEEQRRALVNFCQGVLSRPRPHFDTDLATVAAALLMAVGRLDTFDELGGQLRSGVTRRLSAFGRALLPASGQQLAQPALNTAQVNELQALIGLALRVNAPLSLMPPVGDLPAGERAWAEALLTDLAGGED